MAESSTTARTDPGEGRVVIFAGGGTGGHLYPALAIAAALEARRPDVRVHFLGARRGIEAHVLPHRGLPHTLLPIRGVHRGRGVIANLGVLPAVARSFLGALELFADLRPALVVLTGGYAAAPAGMVARLTGTPLVLQEQNAHPGVVTRRFSTHADEVHVAFPEAIDLLPEGARGHTFVSGNPIAPPVPVDRDAALAGLGLDPGRPVVLVVGGSQGSEALNRAVIEMLDAGMPTPEWQLLWGTGTRHAEAAIAAWDAAGRPAWVHPIGFLHDMPAALGIAAMAVSRAGAMATSEFLAWGLPAVLVPLPTAAADHQTKNATALAEAGCAELLPESELSGRTLRGAIDRMMSDPDRRAAVRTAALGRARPEAADRVAAALERLLPPPRRAA